MNSTIDKQPASFVLGKTLQELEAQKDRIETELNSIKTQVELAIANQKVTGHYADPRWMASAKSALRWKGQHHQRVLAAAAKIRKESKQSARSVESRFVDVAKRLLNKDVFQSILDEAREDGGSK